MSKPPAHSGTRERMAWYRQRPQSSFASCPTPRLINLSQSEHLESGMTSTPRLNREFCVLDHSRFMAARVECWHAGACVPVLP